MLKNTYEGKYGFSKMHFVRNVEIYQDVGLPMHDLWLEQRSIT